MGKDRLSIFHKFFTTKMGIEYLSSGDPDSFMHLPLPVERAELDVVCPRNAGRVLCIVSDVLEHKPPQDTSAMIDTLKNSEQAQHLIVSDLQKIKGACNGIYGSCVRDCHIQNTLNELID